jgi:hypothetical protein
MASATAGWGGPGAAELEEMGRVRGMAYEEAGGVAGKMGTILGAAVAAFIILIVCVLALIVIRRGLDDRKWHEAGQDRSAFLGADYPGPPATVGGATWDTGAPFLRLVPALMTNATNGGGAPAPVAHQLAEGSFLLWATVAAVVVGLLFVASIYGAYAAGNPAASLGLGVAAAFYFYAGARIIEGGINATGDAANFPDRVYEAVRSVEAHVTMAAAAALLTCIGAYIARRAAKETAGRLEGFLQIRTEAARDAADEKRIRAVMRTGAGGGSEAAAGGAGTAGTERGA